MHHSWGRNDEGELYVGWDDEIEEEEDMDQGQFIAILEHCISRVARGDVGNIDVSIDADGSVSVNIYRAENVEALEVIESGE